jgi:hypothetical protein
MNPLLVTGRYGIGPISQRRLSQGMALMRTALVFQRCKEMALDCLRRGDREGARFYGTQARADWRSICHQLTA